MCFNTRIINDNNEVDDMEIEIKEVNKIKRKEAVDVITGAYVMENTLGDERIAIANRYHNEVLVLGIDFGGIYCFNKALIPRIFRNIRKIKSLKIEYEV